jgi:hypothetical protein
VVSLGWPTPAPLPETPRIEVDVRHQDILRAEADALGCLLTPDLQPGDEASRQLFDAAGESLHADLRWALGHRGRARLLPGEAVTVAVRREYPVGRVGFLLFAAPDRSLEPPEAEALVLAAFLREAQRWGFESLALPVSPDGLGVTLAAAARLLAGLRGEGRPVVQRIHFLAREADRLAVGPRDA